MTVLEGVASPEAERGKSRARRGLLEGLAVVAIVVAVVAGVFAIGRAVSTGTSKASAPLVSPADIANAAANAHGQVDDRGFSKLENGVQHSHGWEQPVAKADRQLLSHQMIVARETALQYPTLADAEHAGFRRAGPFSPGLGTHLIAYGNYGYGAGTGGMSDDQIRHPLAWIYDGTKPDSPVAGLFYTALVENPAGFAGPNDVWHKHSNICTVQAKGGGIDTPLGADRDATKAECDAVGGSLLEATGPLLHVWVVPGYEDSQGVFAHLSPGVTCDDGTYNVIDVTKIGNRKTVCVDGSE
jgi:hypothetical protein